MCDQWGEARHKNRLNDKLGSIIRLSRCPKNKLSLCQANL